MAGGAAVGKRRARLIPSMGNMGEVVPKTQLLYSEGLCPAIAILLRRHQANQTSYDGSCSCGACRPRAYSNTFAQAQLLLTRPTDSVHQPHEPTAAERIVGEQVMPGQHSELMQIDLTPQDKSYCFNKLDLFSHGAPGMRILTLWARLRCPHPKR